MTDMPPDPYVRRVNALVTTFLDLLATLLLASAAFFLCWQAGALWAGLLAAAVVISLLSAYAQWRATPRGPKPSTDDEDTIDLPGPTDPGNLHVMGR